MTAHVHRHRTLGTYEPPHKLEQRGQQLDRTQRDLVTWPESMVQAASAPAFSPPLAPHHDGLISRGMRQPDLEPERVGKQRASGY